MKKKYPDDLSNLLCYKFSLFFIIFILFLVIVSFISNILLLHHDIGWHIATGDLIRETGQIPKSDPWSYTAENYLWINLSWLWDIAVSFIHESGGLKSLLLYSIVLTALIPATISLSCIENSGRSFISIFCVVFYVGVCLLAYELPDTPCSISPQTITLLLISISHYLLYSYYNSKKTVYLLVLLLIMPLWVNFHGGFVALYISLFFIALQSLYEHKYKYFMHFSLIGIICIFITVINPLGLDIFLGIFRNINYAHKGSISEWMSFDFNMFWPATFYVLLLIVLGDFKSPKISLFNKLITLFWLLMGLMERRHFSLFLITSAPFMVQSIDNIITENGNYITTYYKKISASYNALFSIKKSVLVLFILSTITVYFIPSMINKRYPENVNFAQRIDPLNEIEFILKNYKDYHLFNDWNFGSFIIYHTRGEIHPIIDGRGPTAYPPKLIDDYTKFSNFIDWDVFFQKYNIKIALIPHYRSAYLFYFKLHPDWIKVFEGTAGVVFVKKPYVKLDIVK